MLLVGNPVRLANLLLLVLPTTWSTLDMNMSELEYVADHLSYEECRRLVAALHTDSYDLDPRVETVGFTLPESASCLEFLIHWNSSPGEGLGQTHEVMSRRLKQLGHSDLSTWLSRMVYQEMSAMLISSVQSPSCTLTTTTTEPPPHCTIEVLEDFEAEVEEQTQWTPLDSVWMAVLAALGMVAILLMVTLVTRLVKKILRCDKRENAGYKLLNNEA